MRKTMTILMLIVLTAVLMVGCSKKADNLVNTQPSTTSGNQQNTAVDATATQGISDASNTSNTLDTTQVDTQLGSANKSLASW